MDPRRAKQYEEQLKGKSCDGWEIADLINAGKSAAVFRATRGTELVALKVFDEELITRYGEDVQKARIERELNLVGMEHPNMVRILGGGFWREENLHYVVMEYIPWKNLAEVLQDIPRGYERSIVGQLASAAHFLHENGYCHRDIKPENIAISPDFKSIKLLDLGVMKPHGDVNVTDLGGRMFVGTLRYGPPEMLKRMEEDTPDGWAAISFYQIGAVLHDLITRKPLFIDFENPYPLLVETILSAQVTIESGMVDADLRDLARYCLIKDPALRSRLVKWSMFQQPLPVADDPVSYFKQKILRDRILKKGAKAPLTRPVANLEKLREYANAIDAVCRLECVENPEIFPPVEIETYSEVEGSGVAIFFSPSPNHALYEHVAIYFHVALAEEHLDLVKISACGMIFSTEPPRQPDGSLRDEMVIRYEGFFPDSTRDVVIPVLYQAIATATDSYEATGKIHIDILES